MAQVGVEAQRDDESVEKLSGYNQQSKEQPTLLSPKPTAKYRLLQSLKAISLDIANS